jgi:hypothetical protein
MGHVGPAAATTPVRPAALVVVVPGVGPVVLELPGKETPAARHQGPPVVVVVVVRVVPVGRQAAATVATAAPAPVS